MNNDNLEKPLVNENYWKTDSFRRMAFDEWEVTKSGLNRNHPNFLLKPDDVEISDDAWCRAYLFGGISDAFNLGIICSIAIAIDGAVAAAQRKPTQIKL